MDSINKKKLGELIECTDEAIHEFIVHLNTQKPQANRFIITDIPPTRLFVKEGYADELRKCINDLVSENTFAEENRFKPKTKKKKSIY